MMKDMAVQDVAREVVFSVRIFLAPRPLAFNADLARGGRDLGSTPPQVELSFNA